MDKLNGRRSPGSFEVVLRTLLDPLSAVRGRPGDYNRAVNDNEQAEKGKCHFPARALSFCSEVKSEADRESQDPRVDLKQIVDEVLSAICDDRPSIATGASAPGWTPVDIVSDRDMLWSADQPEYLFHGLFGYPSACMTQEELILRMCFVEGTMLATPAGERAIEEFAMGDEILAADGAVDHVRWVGHQRIVGPARELTPVRLKAGALSEGCPRRDLLVSPDQALLFPAQGQAYAGVFVNASALVNGKSITDAAGMPTTFRYYRIELASGSVLFAEGAAVDGSVNHYMRQGFLGAGDSFGRRITYGDGCSFEDADSSLDGLHGSPEDRLSSPDIFDSADGFEEAWLPRARSARQVPAWLSEPIGRRAEELFRRDDRGKVPATRSHP